MRNFFIGIASCFFLIALISSFSWAQSPPASAENAVDGVKIKIDYHSPKVKGRIIWGGLEAYDKVWRTGADNEPPLK